MQQEMVVEVRLFAQAREILSSPRVKVHVASSCTVADLKQRLATQHPDLAELLGRSAVAINRTYATDETQIAGGDEIAVIPPVAGG